MLYGQLSEKADVYSFGVLLLEIVSGNRNKDPSQSEDDVYLPTRVGLSLPLSLLNHLRIKMPLLAVENF